MGSSALQTGGFRGQLLLAELLSPIGALLGAAIGYHIMSRYGETHAGQSDLKKVGWPFCLLFLPTANIIIYGVLLRFCYGGATKMLSFFRAIFPW